MEGFEFGGDNTASEGPGMGITTMDPYMGVQHGVPELVTITRSDLDYQQNYIQMLENANITSQHEVERQHRVIGELISFNHNMQSAMSKLDARVAQLEHGYTYCRSLTAINAATPPLLNAGEVVANKNASDGEEFSPYKKQNEKQAISQTARKRPVADAFEAEGLAVSSRTKYRKKLEVKIPGKVTGGPLGLGLPTPIPSAMPSVTPAALASAIPTTPRTPYTPGRIGPPDSYKKTTTSINKRDIHNLNKSIPPAHVQLPLVPLTDTEVIVYFFNSLSRPIVSLRLYARNWGPASIVQALNDHRMVDPPYLRNTCSVKCTTAIKNGRKQWGEDWEVTNRAILSEADDPRATDLIRDTNGEDTVDYDVRALCVNLKKHPSGDDAGIFTQCVKYCVEKNAPYTLHNVWRLAVDLQDGRVPQHPVSPASSDLFLAQYNFRRDQEDETEDEWTGDEASYTPSPLAERKSYSTQSVGSVRFTAVNAQGRQSGDEDG